MFNQPRPFWPPLIAGISLGAVLLLTFLITGHGLGASGFFTRAATAAGLFIAPEAIKENAYLVTDETGRMINPHFWEAPLFR